jgi:hypothetical protein
MAQLVASFAAPGVSFEAFASGKGRLRMRPVDRASTVEGQLGSFDFSYRGSRPSTERFRCLSGTPSDLIYRIPVSIVIGLCEAAGVEVGLGERALALDEMLFGLRAAEESAVLGRFRLLTPAFLQLSGSTQIDDLSQRTRPGYFLRKASIETTLVSPAGSAGFSAF